MHSEIVTDKGHSTLNTPTTQVEGNRRKAYLFQKFIQPSGKSYDATFKNVSHFNHFCKGGPLYSDNSNNKINNKNAVDVPT
jgi:hypothetical protein